MNASNNMNIAKYITFTGSAILLAVCLSFYVGWEFSRSSSVVSLEVNQRIEKFKNERKKLDAQLVNMQSTLGEAKSTNSRLKNGNKELEQKFVATAKELDSLKLETAQLMDKLNTFSDVESHVKTLRDRNYQLSNQVNELRKKHDTLATQFVDISDQAAKFKDKYEAEVSKLKEMGAQYDAEKQVIDRLHTQLNERRLELSKQTKNLNLLQRKNSKLTSNISELNIEIDRLSGAEFRLNAELKNLHSKLEKKQAEVTNRNLELKHLEAKISGLQMIISSVQRELKEKNSQYKIDSAQDIVREYFEDLDEGRTKSALSKWMPSKRGAVEENIKAISDAKIVSTSMSEDGSFVKARVTVRNENANFKTWDLQIYFDTVLLISKIPGIEID